MFGDALRHGTGGPSAYNTFEDLKKQFLGTSTALNGNPVNDVDDRLGYRVGQSRAVQTTRIPKINLVVRCTGGTTANQPQEKVLCSMVGSVVHNVTGIGMNKVHITGIVGNFDNLFISFYGDNTRHALQTSTTLFAGFPSNRNMGLVVEGNPIGSSVLVVPGNTQLVASFFKPQEIERLYVSLQDLSGNSVPFSELVIWLELETEIWQ
jgi:hypothetical protein